MDQLSSAENKLLFPALMVLIQLKWSNFFEGGTPLTVAGLRPMSEMGQKRS
jgi:hypothetical protein